MPAALPRYDIARSYDWNYDHAPDPVAIEVPAFPGDWTFCGLKVASPLGMPAGPLLNGRWLLYYASLGFDNLTYKTVRSSPRACYSLPNLQPVRCGQLTGEEQSVPAIEEMRGSWAVSFGMPSKAPDLWRADIETTRGKLPAGKLLSVSVVGTMQDGWTIDDLAADYAKCAQWAAESGADCVETNFSCPNVSTCDGQLYQDFAAARQVAATVREAIGNKPYIIKIGRLANADNAERLVEAVAPFANALAMTNSVATTITDSRGELMFDGQRRGICGDATRRASIEQVRTFSEIIRRRGDKLELVGVGGAGKAKHVAEFLEAGASSLHIATAAMVDPGVAIKIRREWR